LALIHLPLVAFFGPSDADLNVFFHKSDSHIFDSSSKRVYGISRIDKVFQADFSCAQSFVKYLISQFFLSFESGIGD
jgi:hypothetical protein